MTLFVDTSALVQRYVDEAGRGVVLEAMAGDDVWCASALCRAEALLVLHRMASTRRQAEHLRSALDRDWDAFHVVPVDDRCLAEAAELGSNYDLALSHAVHLAAAARLPRPVCYLTFDDRQVGAAVDLDLRLLTWTG